MLKKAPHYFGIILTVLSLAQVSLAGKGTTNGKAAAGASTVTTPKTAEDLVLENPVRVYKKFYARLKKYGANAPFPEFKPLVDELKARLQAHAFKEKINANPALGLEWTEVVTELTHVNLEFTVDSPESYPYAKPFEAPFPYRPTLDAVESALKLFDKVERLTNPNAVPLYHFDRYAYHRHALLADPEVVVFPTLRNLTFQDLIRVRSAPIGFVGVITETIRVDRHYQTPLDFWYHDLNHVRRMVAYTALKVKQRGAKNYRDKIKIYEEMDRFIVEKIIPNIEKLPKGSAPEAVALRRLVRLMIFEIVHETALAVDSESIIGDLLRPPNTPQPFEYMVPTDARPTDEAENLRTTTGNLKSGVSVQSTDGKNDPILIRYFNDRALSLLANVYNKLNFGFFDDPDHPSSLVTPLEFRTPEFVVKAAQEIFRILEYKNPPSSETLREWVVSQAGSPEKFIYKTVLAGEVAKQGPQATEPLTADEVVRQVRPIGKTVYTLFGYSKLDYENKSEAIAKIRAELGQLDPKTTVINIGTTQEGIGAAYEIAKSMGFETIGIVSTQALTYSGKFSPFVDRIFIVNDKLWGGYIPGTKELAPATRAFIEASDVISAHGGGLNTAITITEAQKMNKKVYFTPAEMNHAKAVKEAENKGTIVPTEFKGAAHSELEKTISGTQAPALDCKTVLSNLLPKTTQK